MKWPFCSSCVIAVTPVDVRIWMPALVAVLVRQSMMVCESSVMGNILPSGSVFRVTPWVSNHVMVSVAPHRWSGPMSDWLPRG